MEIKPIVCPNCGAKIEIGSEAKQCNAFVLSAVHK